VFSVISVVNHKAQTITRAEYSRPPTLSVPWVQCPRDGNQKVPAHWLKTSQPRRVRV